MATLGVSLFITLDALGTCEKIAQVGSDLTATEAAAAADYTAANRGVALVSLDWLRRCAARQARLPADARFLLPLASLVARRKVGGVRV